MSPEPSVPLILCNGTEYHSAGEVFGGISTEATTTHTSLITVLAAHAGMAGSDSVGQEWAKAYDEAARLTLSASSKLATASGRTRDLLVVGAYNHAVADAAANHNEVPPPAAPQLLPSPCLVESAPSAAGDGIPEPFGWSLIKDMVGWAWPNGHQDQLHSAETAWHTAAADFHLLAAEVPQAVSLLSSSQSDEIPTAVATCNDRKSDLTDLGDICRLLGEACGTYATQLDEAHHKILAELKEFAIETGIAEGAFALLTPFTAGLSEWIGNTALGARLAVKARRIATIITELATKAREITTRLGKTLLERVGSLAEKVGSWIEQAKAKLIALARHAGGSNLPKFETTAMNPKYLGENLPGNSVWPGREVKYLTAAERQRYQIFVRDGKLYDADGKLFDTSAGSSVWGGGGNAIFVMDDEGNLFASLQHGPGQFHHSSFLGGAPVAGAGELRVVNGELRLITDSSGHYAPAREFTDQVIENLRSQGVKIDPSQVHMIAPR